MSGKFNIESSDGQCILLAPLDWGLGHTTRCIPIIRHLLEKNCKVIVAGNDSQIALLQKEFPFLEYVFLKGYELKFSTNRFRTIVKIVSQIPGILFSIRRENRWLQRFAIKKRLDAVISDNRYGFFLKNVYSVFITHQLTIKTPFGEKVDAMLRRINYGFILRFNACWIPDSKGSEALAGDLSNPPSLPPLPVYYIGNLTRFTPGLNQEKNFLLLVMISGPEPQRSRFEALVLSQASSNPGRMHVIRGLPKDDIPLPVAPSNVTIENHREGSQLQALIASASIVVSRPGYTTVMELLAGGKRCIFIPTPGQSEQEYLGKFLADQGYSLCANQSDFQLSSLLGKATRHPYRAYKGKAGPDQLVMDRFLENISSAPSGI